jgi:hypothetical protein
VLFVADIDRSVDFYREAARIHPKPALREAGTESVAQVARPGCELMSKVGVFELTNYKLVELPNATPQQLRSRDERLRTTPR